MNIFRIFLESGLAAQIIMVVLVGFSIWSWAIFFKKLFGFSRLKRRNKRFLASYRFRQGLGELKNLGSLLDNNPYGRILRTGLEEFRKQKTKQPQKFGAEFAENIRLAMERKKLGEVSDLESSLPTLATFVSVSPFLGLLGTVWGIMEAFLDIRARGSAHIAVVAPGISDALITTVYGLLVAIPALIFYNYFRSQVDNDETNFNEFISEAFVKFRRELIETTQ